MKIRHYQQKKDYFIYEMFYTNFMVTTKHKSRTEAWNIKKEETVKKYHRKPQNQDDRLEHKEKETAVVWRNQ